MSTPPKTAISPKHRRCRRTSVARAFPTTAHSPTVANRAFLLLIAGPSKPDPTIFSQSGACVVSDYFVVHKNVIVDREAARAKREAPQDRPTRPPRPAATACDHRQNHPPLAPHTPGGPAPPNPRHPFAVCTPTRLILCHLTIYPPPALATHCPHAGHQTRVSDCFIKPSGVDMHKATWHEAQQGVRH